MHGHMPYSRGRCTACLHGCVLHTTGKYDCNTRTTKQHWQRRTTSSILEQAQSMSFSSAKKVLSLLRPSYGPHVICADRL